MNRAEFEAKCSKAAYSLQLSNNRLLVVTHGDIVQILDAADNGIGVCLARDGFWEAWVSVCMHRLVKPGMRVANIGANYGYYALMFSRLVGPSGLVHAIEPNPAVCACLAQSKVINECHNLQVINCAVSDITGTTALVLNAGNSMNGYIRADRTSTAAREQEEASVTRKISVDVSVDTLDNLVPEPLDLVFMDVEGSEEDVWDGMTRARETASIFVIEYAPGRRYGRGALGFAEAMLDGGKFAMGIIDFEGGVQPITPAELVKRQEDMVVLTRVAS